MRWSDPNTGLRKLRKEKNSLGRWPNLGGQGGNLAIWGTRAVFLVLRVLFYLPIYRMSRFFIGLL